MHVPLKRLVSALLLCALSATTARADVVLLKNGERIEGAVTVGETNVEVRTASGTRTIPKAQVKRHLRSVHGAMVRAGQMAKKATALIEEGKRIEGNLQARKQKYHAAANLCRAAIEHCVDARKAFPQQSHEKLDQVEASLRETLQRLQAKIGGPAAAAPIADDPSATTLDAPPPPTAEPVKAAPAVPARLPVPPSSERSKTLQAVKKLYRDAYGKIAPEEKQLLAQRLLKDAAAAGEDVTLLYVMLDQARTLATSARDIKTALKAVEALGRRFETDRYDMIYETLRTFSRSAKTKEALHLLARHALTAAKGAMADEEPEAAASLAAFAAPLARRISDALMVERAAALAKEASELKRELKAVEPARKKLAEKPDDPAANLTIGKYLCFVKGEWDRGLAHLEKGSDSALKAAAGGDRARPENPTERVVTGDRWWDAAAKQSGAARTGARVRAGYWYALALPAQKGVLRLRLEKRLEEIAALEASLRVPPPSTWESGLVRPVPLPHEWKGYVVQFWNGRFPAGDFEWLDRGGKPIGWAFPNGVTLERMGTNHFMRLTQHDPGLYLNVNVLAELPADWKGVTLTGRARLEGLEAGGPGRPGRPGQVGPKAGEPRLARIRTALYDPATGGIARFMPLHRIERDQPWETFRITAPLQPGDSRIFWIAVELAWVKGVLDVDDLKITEAKGG